MSTESKQAQTEDLSNLIKLILLTYKKLKSVTKLSPNVILSHPLSISILIMQQISMAQQVL